MNDLCQLNTVDRCYTCINTENIAVPHPPVCVPIYQNTLGALDNYPSNSWNCTMYRPDTDSKEEIIKDICEIDEFIVGLCHDENIDGICMIASYIKDLCQQADKEYREQEDDINDTEESEGVEDMIEEIVEINEVAKYNNLDDEDLGLTYSSPWGKKSQCMTPFYQKLCKDDVIKSCYDCRTSVLNIGPVKTHYYHCHTVSASEEESDALKWLGEQNYECSKMVNNNFNSKEKKEVSLTGIMLLYPACNGPICQKEGWSYQQTLYGKDWCGNGECKPYGNRRVYCDVQNVCGVKRSTPINMMSFSRNTEHADDMFSNHFTAMACGKEKFKCMLSKGCRNLLKEIEKCNEDYACIYPIIMSTENESFNKLATCMFGK